MDLSAANTLTTETVNLPIVRPAGGRGRSTIMEFLWLDVFVGATDFGAAVDEVTFAVSTGAVPTVNPAWEDGNTVARIKLDHAFVTSGSTIMIQPLRYNLQDASGFGQLIATDKIHITGDSNGMAAATIFQWRIYYRYVTVGMEEYVGIVQSQLSS
jgi:hypothetical protein